MYILIDRCIPFVLSFSLFTNYKLTTRTRFGSNVHTIVTDVPCASFLLIAAEVRLAVAPFCIIPSRPCYDATHTHMFVAL